MINAFGVSNKIITYLPLLCMVEIKSEATHILVICQSETIRNSNLIELRLQPNPQAHCIEWSICLIEISTPRNPKCSSAVRYRLDIIGVAAITVDIKVPLCSQDCTDLECYRIYVVFLLEYTMPMAIVLFSRGACTAM